MVNGTLRPFLRRYRTGRAHDRNDRGGSQWTLNRHFGLGGVCFLSLQVNKGFSHVTPVDVFRGFVTLYVLDGRWLS